MSVVVKPKVVKLTTPIMRGDEAIESVTLREPKSGECRGVSLFEVARFEVTVLRTLVPRISDITVNEFDMLGAKDLMAVAGETASFFME